jgi:nucleoside 2-deoxyribosyltransferase
MITIYLAGRIHNASEDEIHSWREEVKKSYPQFSYLDPTRHRFIASNDSKLTSEEKAVVHQDLQDIRQTDVLLGYIQSYSAGTSMEIFAARTQGRLVVLV